MTKGRSGNGFGEELKAWRAHRGWSQLELSLEAGVSPRHISFLETGRSQPSRSMVLRLLETLDVPLRDRNQILLTAGFAPAYAESSLDEENMAQVRHALRLLLDRHDPCPAYAMDGAWNVIDGNRTHFRLLEALLPKAPTDEVNVLRLLLAPDLLRPHIGNWEACARAVLRRVKRRLDTPTAPEALVSLMTDLRRDPDVDKLMSSSWDPESLDVVVPLTLCLGERRLRWLTALISFGAALDVTVEELTIECFFPADEATERWVDGRG